MKLLLDNNISHRLLKKIQDMFPNSTHVMTEELDESEDYAIWKFAKINNYAIVTKDSDFSELSIINGFPPKIICLRIGNCKISDIEKIIRHNIILLNEFLIDSKSGIIEVHQ
ncbi:MAG: DUF5615 family PIN-like protein [Methylococcales bacterium]|jgi:predicted nuclease of predicted toxin-antitoxin system|nr:DUF5615 family PIN-like protein [Methylococcales bacterium]MBT7408185.1 DUF5615 family PIN-like protein [Methylococcales bacterium]